MLAEPLLTSRREDGLDIPLLLWRPPEPLLGISSAALGGGIGIRHWVINATVPMSYRRDDPDVHLTELSAALSLPGPGVGLLTGVDVAALASAQDEGVQVWATVGLGTPVRAAEPALEPGSVAASAPVHTPGPASAEPVPPVGTINVVAYLPTRLRPAALVNLVATAAEAKAQAVGDLGLQATGTPTDALCLLCPADGAAAEYGGPRSLWGARLARAVHRAVYDGGARDLAHGVPWSEMPDRRLV